LQDCLHLLLPTWNRVENGEIGAQVSHDSEQKLQLTLFESDTQKVSDALLDLDLEQLTPRQALDKLFEIKELIKNKKSTSGSKKA